MQSADINLGIVLGDKQAKKLLRNKTLKKTAGR